jgi:hypothetical protein
MLFSFEVLYKGNGNKDIRLSPQVKLSIIIALIFFIEDIISTMIAKQK